MGDGKVPPLRNGTWEGRNPGISGIFDDEEVF
jgi:hypothetical protein